MNQPTRDSLETDPRFPSGPWTGFFLQRILLVQLKGWMELHLTFSKGGLTGEGRDRVGEFILHGFYSAADGKCRWTKRYVGKHDVFYQGFNEGKGIWGTWEIPENATAAVRLHGGFHIWPEGMADPTEQHLKAEAEPPLVVTEEIPAGEQVPQPVGGMSPSESA
jgi:hypothetical protein